MKFMMKKKNGSITVTFRYLHLAEHFVLLLFSAILIFRSLTAALFTLARLQVSLSEICDGFTRS